METIYKYEFNINSIGILTMPKGAKPLAVQLQNSKPCLWAEVDIRKDSVERILRIFSTGYPVDTYGRTYVGTIQIDEFVWHCYLNDEY